MIRLLIADDQQLVRAGLRMLCESAPDVQIVGEAADGAQAVREAARCRPDVVLMDLRMPVVDGIAATRKILTDNPEARVVALTTFDDDDHLYPALAAGAHGFLVKDSTPEELLAAIRRADTGEQPFSPGVLRRLVSRVVREEIGPEPPNALHGLTPRELDVLVLLAEGLGNHDIAERLHVGVTTVKTHVAALMTKTGADNRVRLAVLAHSAGLL
ncbi:response regulator [Lentzea flaviverrucosa]|uniref:DNA-binding response regulator, NarL/FixJ family, contains REC and HTH domains n=1 Tax=Lentzea flaviverrucosa TaxID=200379 RepID=A0A1H9XWU5_9PSEU|nr:response regulator transcription factor [Lentzea flaviverrucosa]RDI34255.1 LuxR family two component transcriptional regulator [Lentzea flaviverrucosa]SES50574.1 DNA-binding response regulator, NarL/FixJ family, contains REC and HTH domains [Lentzea flaviverrucosa]